MRWVWHRLSSPRLTLALMAALAGICVIGLIAPQYPGLDSGSPPYDEWVQSLGSWAQVPGLLRILNIFQSPWLIVAAALLGINTIVCVARSLLRRRGTAEMVTASANAPGDSPTNAQGQALSERTEVSPVLARARSLAEDRGYKVKASGSHAFRAEKNVFGRMGPYVLHLSLVVILLGICYAAVSGFQEPFVVVVEGEEQAVGHGTGLSVRLSSAAVEYWQDGSPREYQSRVDVLRDGYAIARGNVMVNHPLSAGGVRLFQTGFGSAPELLVTDESEGELYRGAVPLIDVLTMSDVYRPVGVFRLESPPLDVRVIGPAVNASDPVISADQVALQFFEAGSSVPLGFAVVKLEQSLTVGGLSFTYAQQRQFSVFTVTRDPARLVLWVGCGLFLVGLMILLFWPYRLVRVGLERTRRGHERVTVHVLRPHPLDIPSDLQRLSHVLGAGVDQQGSGNE